MKIQNLIFLFLFLFLCNPIYSFHEEMESNYYGFVSYYPDEYAPLDDAFPVIFSLGAGWSQAEGPNMLSKAASWGNINPVSLDVFDWSGLEWTKGADLAGLNILMTINPGHDNKEEENYSPWVICPEGKDIPASMNCPPKDYNEWYNFVYSVVEHFDGKHGSPEIRYFMSMGENDSDVNYWLGTKEEYYGGGKTVIITRKGDKPPIEIYAALLPVLYLAVKDANPNAKVVMGASSAGWGYISAHLFEMYNEGALEEEILNQLHKYASNLTYTQFVDWLYTESAVRGREFFYQSLKFPQYYDNYAIHYYQSAGYYDAMSFVMEKLKENNIDKPVWATGVGLLMNPWLPWEPYGELQYAYYQFERMIESYSVGIDWFDFSFLVDWPLLGPIGIYENKNLDYPKKNPVGYTYSFLTRIFTDTDHFTSSGVFTPEEGKILFLFEVVNKITGKLGHLATGWCFNECPQEIGKWCNDSCPKLVDIEEYLDISQDTKGVLYDILGNITSSGNISDLLISFDIAPFILIWGENSDNDFIPDISDNCPFVDNPDQVDDGKEGEIIIGVSNKAIPAPDSIGYLCDNCPGLSNRAQSDDDDDKVGNPCDNCPLVFNPKQEDKDQDKIGDLCDPCPDKKGNRCCGMIYLNESGNFSLILISFLLILPLLSKLSLIRSLSMKKFYNPQNF